ncbi:hypothetical protein BKA65DRAFT_494372 [Rhexocercosporidium sp. MPI-PUGE-AT-0058]|nr:hypothetical protein BKA65DRAFT_494372 [Rhexocercosporidium sp. MPI-PUGE-AT-0058]
MNGRLCRLFTVGLNFSLVIADSTAQLATFPPSIKSINQSVNFLPAPSCSHDICIKAHLLFLQGHSSFSGRQQQPQEITHLS